jgi:hypothetical protein
VQAFTFSGTGTTATVVCGTGFTKAVGGGGQGKPGDSNKAMVASFPVTSAVSGAPGTGTAATSTSTPNGWRAISPGNAGGDAISVWVVCVP